ncbi:MAG: alpha-hydroxy-acid oxidizing protein [Planctomycetes bacterium]|nr:alpha-hydroxy-acid oxidizing protein [Planctomycetota bacterium]
MEELPDIGMPLGDAERVLENARIFAHVHRMQRLGTESLLAALIADPTPEIAAALDALGVDIDRLQRMIDEFFVDLPGRRTTRVAEMGPTPRVKLVIKLAAQLARKHNESGLSPTRLFEAIHLETDSSGGQMLARLSRRTSDELPHAHVGLHTTTDFRRAAKLKMDPVAFDYFASGADAQKLKKRNRRAWDELEIRHRVLVNVADVDTSTELLGLKLPFPAMIAPMAYQRLAHSEGELATARAAAEAGVPLVVSTMANVTLEAIAAATSAPKWFQLYCHRDRRITEDLIRRAEAAGYRAIVVTVDAPVLGRRVADERNNFDLPEGLTRANLARYEAKGGVDSGSELAELFRTRQDASLTWKDIEWFKSLTRLPILLKGVVRGDDAKRASDAGCAGLIVSNHGGRQLDASIASARALPEVVAAVEDRIPVLVDGSIEWGADILRALALGAKAVLIGRPVLWGLAVSGETGVKRVLDLYAEDFKRAMQLAGSPAVNDLGPDLLAR